MEEVNPKRKLLNIVLLCCAAVLLVGIVNYFVNGRARGKKIDAAGLMERYQTACQEAGLPADWEADLTAADGGWTGRFAAEGGTLTLKVEQNDKGYLKAAQFQWDTGTLSDEAVRAWVNPMFLCADAELARGDLDSLWYNLTDPASLKKNEQGADTASHSLHKMAYSYYRDEHFTAVLVGDPGAYK